MCYFLLKYTRILQRFNSGMLTIKYPHIPCLPSFITLSLTLMCALNVAYGHADTMNLYRDEPISPIPQQVEVDEARARLGEMLFFDTRLSANNSISCASCHQLDSGGDDNLATGISLSADQHNINTPSIFNALYNFRQNWDGSAINLHQQIDMVIKNEHEFDNTWINVIVKLAMDNEVQSNFETCYPDGLTKENIIDAIVEFEKTLITPNSRFDRYLRNEDKSLTGVEIKGFTLFKELGCISCHQGTNIGSNLFQKFGIFYNYMAERGEIKKKDYGKFNTTHREMDKFVFKVPSLRNIAVTAPYFHDGSVKTIEEAISIMGKTQLGRTLSEDEIFLIKSFLNTLTGEYKNKPLDAQL